jgi:hypothetical protein
MITAWAVPAPLPAYIGVSQTTEIPVAPDFADTLGPVPPDVGSVLYPLNPAFQRSALRPASAVVKPIP